MDQSIRCKPEKVELESLNNEINDGVLAGQGVGESRNNCNISCVN